MKITALKAQVKKPDRVSVFVDGAFSFSLTLDQLLETGLKKGVELEISDIKAFIKRSEDGKKKARALEWLLNRPHSIQEFRDYCYRKQVEPDLRDAWQAYFIEKNYLNDERFAEWFVELRLRKQKSKRSIIQELVSKGVSISLAREVVLGKQDDDSESLKQLITKLRARSRYQDEKKLMAHLVAKGFSYDDIKSVLSGTHRS